VGTIKSDAAVVSTWLASVKRMADDLRELRPLATTPATVHHGDARDVLRYVEPSSIDAVITSPPYPNEKDYTRTTRLESVVLGFLKDSAELRRIKRQLLRSNTRGVYKEDDDDEWVKACPEVHRIADEIEKRRIELGKTSGFERMYPRVTKLYFGGMARHFAELRHVLRPGAQLAYVVGDQASYLRVTIRTGQLLGEIARSLGYELLGRELFRNRWATATRKELREEVLLLRWPGKAKGGKVE
jgi:DNA modification methylase